MASYIKQEKILSTSWDKISKMTQEELLSYGRSAARLAKMRRTVLIKDLLKENLPIPPSLQRWTTNKNIPDKFNKEPASLSSVIGYDDYDRGYGNVDFSVDKSMSRGELMHKILLAKKFITTETSTIKGWKNYYQRIIDRISMKSNIKISPEDYPKFWELYNKIKQMSKNSVYLANKFEYGKSTEIQQIIGEYMLDRGFNVSMANELFNILESEQQEEYESTQEDEGFFIFGGDK